MAVATAIMIHEASAITATRVRYRSAPGPTFDRWVLRIDHGEAVVEIDLYCVPGKLDTALEPLQPTPEKPELREQ